ncbi:MAG: RnfABCDGE type electron transport complex subunit D [bacterium]
MREIQDSAASEPSLMEVSFAPHLVAAVDIQSIMRDVLLSLSPAGLVSMYLFGLSSLRIIAISCLTAVLTEWGFQRLAHREVRIFDLSALVTGVLLAFSVPPDLPLWTAALGSMLSILVGKELFGGLGFNLFNPALVGRSILLASWPSQMTTWKQPVRAFWGHPEATTSATPLTRLKLTGEGTPYLHLFVGQIGGCLGETSAMALLIGALYLWYRRVIDWRIPVSYLSTLCFFALILRQDPLFHLLAGGLLLSAFFMATDYVTSPITPTGKLMFGAGCGLLTILIRIYGGFPEGVSYAILFMNALTPLIEQFTEPRPYGRMKIKSS